MSFWSLSVTIGNLWVLLVNSGLRNDAVTRAIAGLGGVSVAAFQMFFFAAFAFAAAVGFGSYARRYRMVEHYRSAASP